MTHIAHPEDILFEEGTVELGRVLNNITGGSLKWDGIAVVAGTDEQGRFVSNNSYHNKTPKIYRSVEDLAATKDGIREKLTHLLDRHPGTSNPQINQGDMLWWPGSYYDNDTHRVFMSNIIQYHIPLYEIEGQEVGVAWHTNLVGDQFETDENIWSMHVDIPDVIPVYRPIPEFDKLVDPDFTHVMKRFTMYCVMGIHCHHDWDVFIDWYQNHFKDSDKYIETYNKIVDNRKLVFDVVLNLHMIKHDALWEYNHYLKQREWGTFAIIDDKPSRVSHEGFVLNSRIGTNIKLVDRFQFSRLNRSENVKRGWDLNR